LVFGIFYKIKGFKFTKKTPYSKKKKEYFCNAFDVSENQKIKYIFWSYNQCIGKMPTIEIISVNATELEVNQDEYEVAIILENKLISHRNLFYDFLLTQNGIIIHIGNPDLKKDKDNFYFAGEIINWNFEQPDLDKKRKGLKSNNKNSWANQEFFFQFEYKYKDEIRRIMQSSIKSSPENKIYFLTDNQFGPEKASFKKVDELFLFWQDHDNNGLAWNTLYEIYYKP
jgi:hypothetical protein